MHSAKIPKTLQRELDRRTDIVEEYHTEYDEFEPSKGPYSIWIYLRPGFIDPDHETTQIHEQTAKDALDKLRNVVASSRS